MLAKRIRDVAAKAVPPALKESPAPSSATVSSFTPAPDRPAIRMRVLPKERAWSVGAIIACQAVILVAIFGSWEIAARAKWIDPFFWSQPSKIWDTFTIFVASGNALQDVWYTVRSTILGFFIGTGLGGMLGLSFWWSRNYAAVVQPYLVALEAMPKLALAPLLILVCGVGLPSKVVIGTLLTMIIATLTTASGVRAVDRDGEKLMYSLGASRRQVFQKLIVPSTLPWVISVLRVNIGLALTGSIVGEFIASQHGLGRTIMYAGQTYDIALIWVGVFTLSALSAVMYAAVSRLERVLLKGVRHDAAR
jgi:NitT/TauT family transport system permease protein